MDVKQFLRIPLALDRTGEMAERVAARSRMAVWQRVKDALANLGPAEARGYIRSRSLLVVKEETSRLIEQEGAKLVRIRQRIEAAAMASLTETIVSQMAPPRQSARIRRAA